MATVAESGFDHELGSRQSGSPVARVIDRWIYVFMAGWFLLITLVGFVPFTIDRLQANAAGTKPPFPPILHVHAVLMSAFLLLLLIQTILMATGRSERHQWLGRAAIVLVPAMVVAMILLVPTTYRLGWSFAQSAPPDIRAKLMKPLTHDNTLLLQIRAIVLFPLFMAIALKARRSDPALHKRMIFLGSVDLLLAAVDRMRWLPRPLGHPLSSDLYLLLILSPMFVWDLVRGMRGARAYVLWAVIFAVGSVPVYLLWGTHWWFSTVPQLMRV